MGIAPLLNWRRERTLEWRALQKRSQKNSKNNGPALGQPQQTGVRDKLISSLSEGEEDTAKGRPVRGEMTEESHRVGLEDADRLLDPRPDGLGRPFS